MTLYTEEKTDFVSVFQELKSLGLKVPKLKKFLSNIPKQPRSSSISHNKIFGVNISQQEKISVENYVLPKFIVMSTDYLKQYVNREIGLFRKAGSKLRQKDLQVKLERGESIENCEPNDVACLLKKWLRELPEPLIPTYLQDLFVRCLDLQVEENKIAAILLCCHLLPLDHFHTLKHLFVFLSEIVEHCDKNKMGTHNLALIMAPNIFVMGTDSIDKSSNDLVQQHISIIELLINNAHRIQPPYPSIYLAEADALKFNTDLDTSSCFLDYSPCKSKKKRKSNGVQDLFSGFKKLVGQNALSPNRKRSYQDDSNYDTRSALKRKADDEHSPTMSPLKKQAVVSSVLGNESSNNTPNNKIPKTSCASEKSQKRHTRRKSFNLLKRKEKKSRQKSEKSSVLDSKQNASTPCSFKENIVLSLQVPDENKSFLAPPSISPINFENLFAKSGFMKKSFSDCYLIPNNEGPQNRMFSTSSEGCLPVDGITPPPYCNHALKGSNQINSLKVPNAILPCEKNAVNLKVENSSLVCTSERTENDIKISIRNVSSVESNVDGTAASKLSTEKVEKNSTIVRKESFIMKPKHSKNTLNHLRRADSIKISKLRNQVNKQNSTPNDLSVIDNKNIQKSSSTVDVFSHVKTPENHLSSADKKRTKRSVRNASIVRGRPNTVRTGLPNFVCSRSINDSTLDCMKHKGVSCYSSDEDLFINVTEKSELELSIIKHIERLALSPKETLTKEEKEWKNEVLDSKDKVSFALEKVDSKTEMPNSTNEVINSTNTPISKIKNFEDMSSEIDVSSKIIQLKRLESRKIDSENSRKRLSSNSDSKIRKTKKSVSLSRVNSFPQYAKPRKVKLRAVKSSGQVRKSMKTGSKTKSKTKSKDRLRSISDSKVLETMKLTKISRMNSLPEHVNITKESKVEKLKVVKSSSIEPASIKINDSVSKISDNLDNNSNKKKQESKKKPTQVSRINSLPTSVAASKPRKEEKLRAVKSSSPRKSCEKKAEVSGDTVDFSNLGSQKRLNVKTPRKSGEKKGKVSDVADKKNLLCEKSPKNIYLEVKTPVNKYEPPEQWFSGRKFLEAEEATQKEISEHKRESIAMILRNKKGHVREKASIYEPATRTSCSNTPMMLRSATPSGRYDLQSSQKQSASARSGKSMRRNSPLPLPPIPIFFEPSPVNSYPLKELTNLSNSEDLFFTPPSSQKSLNSSQNSENSSRTKKDCSLKPKMNSFSGHTPFKLPMDRNKVRRSASSPKCLRVISDENLYCSPVFKTKSALSIERLRSDELLDEWNCEM